MRRGTTPVLRATVDADMTGAQRVWVTLGWQGGAVTAEPDSVERDGGSSTAVVRLTQEQTLAMPAGERVRVQVRWLKGGEAFASAMGAVEVEDVLQEGVIE